MATSTEHLNAWLAADLAVANGQSYSIGGRTLTRADAEKIERRIEYWRARVNTESAKTNGGSSLYSLAEFPE